MTPKLAGVAQAFSLLKHNIENDADELLQRINSANDRRQGVKDKSHTALDSANNGMKDIEDFLEAMEGTNGSPNSSASSAPRSSNVATK
jgi:hypothetical protein